MDGGDRGRVQALLSGLTTRGSWDRFDQALVEAVGSGGEDGDRALAEALLEVSNDRKVAVAAALGDARGTAGTDALRAAVFRLGASQDLQCAGLLALAKRNGGAAMADLLAGLDSRNGAVKDYAVLCLAHVGDESAWEPVLHRLKQLLARPARRGLPVSDVVYALCYLASRTGPSPNGLAGLVSLLRSRWERLDPNERAWIDQYWPAAAPSGPPASQVGVANPSQLAAYLLDDPLFAPLNGPTLQERIEAGTPPASHWTRNPFELKRPGSD